MKERRRSYSWRTPPFGALFESETCFELRRQ